MGGDILNHSNFVQHEYLGDKGNSFEPETVTPDKFPGFPSTIDDQGNY